MGHECEKCWGPQKSNLRTHVSKQWADVRSHWEPIRDAPQRWTPSTCRLLCHGHEALSAGLPSAILAVCGYSIPKPQSVSQKEITWFFAKGDTCVWMSSANSEAWKHLRMCLAFKIVIEINSKRSEGDGYSSWLSMHVL